MRNSTCSALFLLSLLIGGCAGTNLRENYEPARSGDFSARKPPAKVVQGSVKSMLENGYTKLGELSVTVDYINGKPDATTLLREHAADKGADAVRILFSNSTGSEQRMYQKIVGYRPAYQHEQVINYRNESVAITKPDYKQVVTLSSRGELWRKDAALAASDLNNIGLTIASLQGNLQKMEQHLKAGGDPNFNSYDMNPLVAAAMAGKEEAVKRLLRAGANPQQTDKLNMKPWHEAALGGRGRLAGLLSEQTSFGEAIAAVSAGDTQQLRAAINKRPKSEAWDEIAIATLAYRAKDPAVLKTLIDARGVGSFRKDREKYLDFLLLQATLSSNYDFMQRLLDAGAPVNVPVSDLLNRGLGVGSSLPTLHYAAMAGDARAVRMLLKAGAYTDTTNAQANGFRPLHWAVQSGNFETVAAVLAKDPSAQYVANDTVAFGKETTPLIIALMRDLLVRKARTEKELSDMTLLMLDINVPSGLTRFTLESMLEGVDKNRQNKQPPREWKMTRAQEWNRRAKQAAAQGNVALAFDLYSAAKHIAYDPEVAADRAMVLKKSSTTPLIDAMEMGWWNDAVYLIHHGYNLHETDKIGWTAVHYAVERAHSKVILALLDRGVKPEAYTPPPEPKKYVYRVAEGGNFLHAAAYDNNAELVKRLISLGASVDSRNDRSKTPLMLAAKKGSAESLRALIAAGANVNAVTTKTVYSDYKDTSVLEFALTNLPEKIDVVRLLLESGANTKIKSHDGKNLVSWARGKKCAKEKPAFGCMKAEYVDLLESSAKR